MPKQQFNEVNASQLCCCAAVHLPFITRELVNTLPSHSLVQFNQVWLSTCSVIALNHNRDSESRESNTLCFLRNTKRALNYKNEACFHIKLNIHGRVKKSGNFPTGRTCKIDFQDVQKSVVHQNFSCFIVVLADQVLSFADRATFV